MQSLEKNSIVKYKFIYTAIILLVYIVGRNIPLYGINAAAYAGKTANAEDLLMQAIGGDAFQRSLFALGISPYMTAALIGMMLSSFRNSESRARVSPQKSSRQTLVCMLIIAVAQSLMQIRKIFILDMENIGGVTKGIAALEMITGAFLILWLISRNKKYGIGGQMVLIMVNLVSGIHHTLKAYEPTKLIVPGMIAVFLLIVVMIMENAEVRIPIQRISIHNIYADKSYLAIKLNPIGVMPAMFSTAFFAIPQFLVNALVSLFPEHGNLLWWQENLSLTKPLGIVVYLLILCSLTIGFSRVFINPRELTEQFLKSGDSIVDLHAGQETKRYLSRVIGGISVVSAMVMSLCLGIPLFLQLGGKVESELIMFPATVMMLTGIWCNLYREYTAVRSLEEYKPFI